MTEEHPFAIDPSPEWLKDERFESLLKRALRRYGIPQVRSGAVVGLVSGELPASTLFCCRSGCQPCARDYEAAAGDVLKSLGSPHAGRWGIRSRIKKFIKPA